MNTKWRKPKSWLLSVTIKPNGEVYERANLISNVPQKSRAFDISKHCLENEIAQKVAVMKLMSGDFTPTSIGRWIGDRHFIVELTEDEFYRMMEKIDGIDPRSKGKRKSKKDPKQIPLNLPDDAGDGGLR